MVRFAKVGRPENALGWYHSHPGYGCWLSGIDVSTQMLNQQYQEPWLAVVVRYVVRECSQARNLFRSFRLTQRELSLLEKWKLELSGPIRRDTSRLMRDLLSTRPSL